MSPLFVVVFDFRTNVIMFRIKGSEHTMVRLLLMDRPNDRSRSEEIVGQAVIPLAALRSGYRHVPLHVRSSKTIARIFSCLLSSCSLLDAI